MERKKREELMDAVRAIHEYIEEIKSLAYDNGGDYARQIYETAQDIEEKVEDIERIMRD